MDVDQQRDQQPASQHSTATSAETVLSVDPQQLPQQLPPREQQHPVSQPTSSKPPPVTATPSVVAKPITEAGVVPDKKTQLPVNAVSVSQTEAASTGPDQTALGTGSTPAPKTTSPSPLTGPPEQSGKQVGTSTTQSSQMVCFNVMK